MILNADQPKYLLESYPVRVRRDIQATMRVFRFEDGSLGYGCQLEQRKDGMYHSVVTNLHDTYGRAYDEAYIIAANEFDAQERLL